MLITKMNFVISISPTKKEEIAAKLSAYVPHDAVLKEVRDCFIVNDQSVNRIHRLTGKDIHNIAATYNIDVPCK